VYILVIRKVEEGLIPFIIVITTTNNINQNNRIK